MGNLAKNLVNPFRFEASLWQPKILLFLTLDIYTTELIAVGHMYNLRVQHLANW